MKVSSVKLVLSGGGGTLEGAVLGSSAGREKGKGTAPLCCSRMGGTRAQYQPLGPEGSGKGEQTPQFPSLWSFTPG